MNRHRALVLLTSLVLSPLALATVGCSQGQSPTESAFDEPVDSSASALSSSTSGDKRRGRGADDPQDSDRRGQGADDSQGSGRQGRGNDDRQRPPRAGAQFAGAVTAVDGSTVILAGGTRVAVSGQTQWNSRGDLFSLNQVAASVASGDPTRIEGRGVRQADGSVLAQTIKAEVDN